MATVNVQLVKELRDRTSLSMGDCKKALEQSNSDIEVAIDLLKKWGELKGKEKAGRVATEGKVWMFSNNSRSTVGMFEVNCQTDFVAKSPEFYDLLSSFSKMNGFSDAEFEIKRKELIAKTGENIVLRRKVIYNCSGDSIIRWYNHQGDRLSAIIEVSSPAFATERVDFDVNSVENKRLNLCYNEIDNFTNECAMQIAAMSPLVVSKDDIPADMIERQRAIFEAQLAEDKKPSAAWPKIIDGKFNKWRKDIVLLEQEYVKEAGKSIGQIKDELAKKLGTEITINRFTRYALGEGLVANKSDLADEVNKLIG